MQSAGSTAPADWDRLSTSVFNDDDWPKWEDSDESYDHRLREKILREELDDCKRKPGYNIRHTLIFGFRLRPCGFGLKINFLSNFFANLE